jgi:DNA adenine methylase
LPPGLMKTTVAPIQPFLKWPGGKRQLTPRLSRLVPESYRRYYEPFVGGGALFFSLQPRRATLGDSNRELVECYREIKSSCDAVIDNLSRLENSEADYYRVRSWDPQTGPARAARLIYLTRLAFNGIYRVNRKTGRFNVPYGFRDQLKVLDEANLRAVSHALRHARILLSDFEHCLRDAGEGDIAYLDPPYTVAHTNNGFVRYNQRLFSWDDQVRLSLCARELAKRSVAVIVSNAPHASIAAMYQGFRVHRFRRSSQIAADPRFRGRVSEVVFTANI